MVVWFHGKPLLLLLLLLLLFYYLGVFHGSLSDSKCPQVTRTLLSILTDLNNAVALTVSIRPVISKPSSPCTNHLESVSRPPITISKILTFMFHSFFNSLPMSRYLTFILSILLWSFRTIISAIQQVLSFLLIIIRSNRLVEIRWSVFMSKSLRSLCVAFSRTESWLCIYHLFVGSNFNFVIMEWPISPRTSRIVVVLTII